MSRIEIKDYLLNDIDKFQKLMKLLNNFENISSLFELIEIQKSLIFNKE